MLNRIYICALSFVFALSLVPVSAFAAVPANALVAAQTAGATQLALADGPIAITESGTYEVAGTGAGPVSIAGDIEVTLVLNGVSIDATEAGASAISVTGGARATLQVVGTNVVTGAVNQAGIQVDKDSALVIEGMSAPSSLTATGNGGIDYRTSAEASAASNSHGAGIGGTAASPNAGSITVNGANRNLTLSAVGGGIGAAGIGSSYGGTAPQITISQTKLVGVHGGCLNAVADKDDGYAKNTLEGGPAIGSGTRGGAGGTVVIRDCEGSDIVGGGKASGIGGGCWAQNARVEIHDSTIDVTGGMTGPAIGSGRVTTGSSTSVLISGSTVTAAGGYYGAGIGLGVNARNDELGVSDVTIVNSDVTATGGAGAAAIGGGVRGYNVNVSIEGASKVTAYSGANYMGSYATRYNDSPDTVTGGNGIGQAGAAAIGRGAWGSVTKFAGYEEEARPKLSISAEADVTAMSNGDNWAIAGFYDTEGLAATLLQTRFDRNYDLSGSNLLSQSVNETEGMLFLDGAKATELVVKDAETNKVVKTIQAPAVGDDFAHGFTGGRSGYYAFATTLPAAGTYTLNTSSDLRTGMAQGDEVVTSDDPRYLGGADYYDGTSEIARYECKAGGNAFDYGSFVSQAAPDPDPEPAPEPAPTPAPDPSDSDGSDGGPGDNSSDPDGSDDSGKTVGPGFDSSSSGNKGSGADSSKSGSGSKSSLPRTDDPLFQGAIIASVLVGASAAVFTVARKRARQPEKR